MSVSWIVVPRRQKNPKLPSVLEYCALKIAKFEIPGGCARSGRGFGRCRGRSVESRSADSHNEKQDGDARTHWVLSSLYALDDAARAEFGVFSSEGSPGQ